MLFGRQYRHGRETCLQNLLALREETPELFALEFLLSIWGPLMYDFLRKMLGGMRRLGHFRRPSDDIAEIRRLALHKHPDGGLIWPQPISFDMSSSRRFWSRNIIHRLEAFVE